jgi:alanyl-tRNA synthetase
VIRSRDIRRSFIDFFVQKKDHMFVPASPVVPLYDPTLLFTNAGMNQFKDYFLGKGSHDWKRVANSQPCIRVSGKHNDLEDVGYDGTHLTLFEMLGNWSFGDYYKKEAIVWAWEFLTEVCQIPKQRLYATVYETDDEAIALWKSVTDIRHDHILRFGKKDNFWEMGDVGPCGPCSEIHVDTAPDSEIQVGPEIFADPILGVNGENQRFIEFWNLVFMQYNRLPDGTLEDLPAKHVDTGMGFERLTSYLQGKTSAYETDLFVPIIEEISRLSGVAYDPGEAGVSHRVMADHIRTIVFSISDNVLPSNDGRGYVIRRLLRRALRYATKLNFHEPVLYRLISVVVGIMGEFYPHLKEREVFVTQLVKSEEESFLRTLDAGVSRFEAMAKGGSVLSGDDAFKLYDTFGFPLDLTQLMARERGMQVDVEGFDAALQAQKDRSRKAAKKEVYVADSDHAHVVSGELLPMDLHHAPIQGVARGGEARVVAGPDEKVTMARHHSATHLLQAALQQILGDHVRQSGSLVDTDRLRFDFTHFQAVTSEQLSEIERIVNQKISEDIPVEILSMGLEEAKAQGAMALFGEKYDVNQVRVVRMGGFSIELCGGTHVSHTGMIEQFRLVSEAAVAAGIRRIEAISGKDRVAAYEADLQAKALEQEQAEQKREEQKRLQKEAEKNMAADLKAQLPGFLSRLEKISDTRFVLKESSSLDMNGLKLLAELVTDSRPDAVVVLAGEGVFVVKVGKQVAPTVDAREILHSLISVAGGRGGGKPDMAQAGGVDQSKQKEALSFLSF